MALKLYDLAAADENIRFSPHCWRIRMALAHKELDVETVPWRFTEKEAISFSGQGAVPILADDEKVIADSWNIAVYLDEAYPDRRPLFACDQAKSHAYFIKLWCEQTVQPGIVKQIMPALFAMLHDKDKPYFRETREKRFGMTLEQFAEGADEALPGFRKALNPLRATLDQQDYLGGAVPSFADYTVFGAFQWARTTSPNDLLEAGDPIAAWRQRLLRMYDGLAEAMPAARASAA